MVGYLPDTALCSMVVSDTVYTYAQTETGSLLELRGNLELIKAPVKTYSYDESTTLIRRYRHDEETEGAPKLFTPLAAAAFTPRHAYAKTQRYLFYVDNNNKIRDMVCQNNTWSQGTLIGRNIECAHYSRLTAITVPNDLYNFICLYYQAPEKNAAIKTASYSGQNGQWTCNKPDLRDPPLYGTSLTAVPPRKGIMVADPQSLDARQPVLYLQLDSLKLAHSQGGEPAEMAGFELDRKPMVFSPHTSLTAVDDGNTLYIIYKSNSNSIKMISVNDGRPLMTPERFEDINPTPSGAIAACLSPSNNQIILFYQSLNRETMKIDLYALTLFKPSTTGTGWQPSVPEKLED